MVLFLWPFVGLEVCGLGFGIISRSVCVLIKNKCFPLSLLDSNRFQDCSISQSKEEAFFSHF